MRTAWWIAARPGRVGSGNVIWADRLEVRSALRQQQMGQLVERLAAEKISVSACDLRELTRDRRVDLGVAEADAERGRAAGAIQVPTTCPWRIGKTECLLVFDSMPECAMWQSFSFT
jgi:hypothetical protein